MTDHTTPAAPEDQAFPRPVVARHTARAPAWVLFAGMAVVAFVVVALLTLQRTHKAAPVATLTARPVSALTRVDFQPPPDVAAVAQAGRGSAFAPARAAGEAPHEYFQTDVAPPPPPPIGGFGATPTVYRTAPPDPSVRRRAPSLIVDLSEGDVGAAGGTPGDLRSSRGAVAVGPAGGSDAAGGQPASTLNGNEQFADRIGSEEPESARATVMRNPGATITQGVIIPAVLETAINSDLPGFVRAVVSRDVRSFNGSVVLIPRGSHVVGQYRSGVAMGQSRAFIIWTRIIRPDGASVQIASSGGDALGRVGLEGKVDRHFFQTFGSSILLSVLNAGVASLGQQPGTQIVIGSTRDASSVAASALAPSNISPTIKVQQGAPIRIFVARDLDFSGVGGSTP